MYRHAPEDYSCPLCLVAAGGNNPSPHCCQSDVVLRTERVCAFIGARFWPNNAAPVVVVPNRHIESIYDLVPEIGVHVHEAARQVALALKRVYDCAGVSTWQHNEPAGDQSVWHYHLHVIPRYEGDRLYDLAGSSRYTEPEERKPHAERLRAYFVGIERAPAVTQGPADELMR
jgi:histidine triad (HIT) family protein